MWKKRVKRLSMVVIVMALLPYVITILMNGMLINTNQTVENSRIRVRDGENILEIPFDEFCIGTLVNEVDQDYEEETLKCQAILVRTSIYKEWIESEGYVVEGNHFLKKSEVDAKWYQTLERIWKETEGQVLLYEGTLALTPFHQLSNGSTRNAEEIFGNDDYPYLTAKDCKSDIESDQYMKSQLLTISSVKILEKDSAGYVTSVKVGNETCTGEAFRDAYGLASSCFEIQQIEDKVRVTTRGIGHGLGLSQYQANRMAKEGHSYEEILKYFFETCELKEVAQILLDTE